MIGGAYPCASCQYRGKTERLLREHTERQHIPGEELAARAQEREQRRRDWKRAYQRKWLERRRVPTPT